HPGYLYILNRAPSGKWPAMFPSAEFQGGDNKVDRLHTYTVPPRAMEFVEPTGVENLTILFAPKPEPDFEKRIRSRGTSGKKSTADLVAGVEIGDELVRKKREMYSRDLRIEKAPPTAPGEPKDNAVYVINAKAGPDSGVFTDLPLVHK